MRIPYVVLFLCLAACSKSEKLNPQESLESLQQNLAGRWLGEATLPDRRILSETVVDSQGRYILRLTNVLSDAVRTAAFAGTLHIQDGLLVDPITNHIGGNTMVPRIASVMKIVRLNKHELVLIDTNSTNIVTYKRSDP